MKFKIPFAISDIDKLRKKSKFFSSKIRPKKNSKLTENLVNIGVNISREEYIGICLRGFFISFITLFFIFTTIIAVLNVKFFYLIGTGLALLFASFILFSRMVYPKVYVARKQREIDKNLISALQDILIQLNSGIPLFSILVNISSGDYGELSSEFKKAVRRINAGEPESEVLDDLGRKNPSLYFRRTLWQISNGMRAGSDTSIIIKDSIKTLNEEQLIQIQNYGNKLNPLVMFYLLLSVIIPSLSVAFLSILASMVGLSQTVTTILFLGLFVFVVLFQVMFLGIIKSRRPSLL